jgi:parallel beta-helix repeat protein
MKASVSLAVVLLALAVAGAARADAVTKISGCPYEIAAPGSYLVVRNLHCPIGTAIGITASDVHLNLGGHTIDGDGNETGGVGIAVVDATDVHINNGTVRRFTAFNADGILLLDASGNQVNDVTLTENFDGLGMSHADQNRIESSDLSRNLRWGAEVSISDANEFQGDSATGNGHAGYALSAADENLLAGGKISGNTVAGVALGLLGVASRNTVRGNDISGNSDGIQVLQGVNNLIMSNQADANSLRGIVVFPGSGGHVIESNTARGNGLFDLEDDNPDCDANTWRHNNFERASQACID